MGHLAAKPLELQVGKGNGQIHGILEGTHQDHVQVGRAGEFVHVVDEGIGDQGDHEQTEGHRHGVQSELPGVKEVELERGRDQRSKLEQGEQRLE